MIVINNQLTVKPLLTVIEQWRLEEKETSVTMTPSCWFFWLFIDIPVSPWLIYGLRCWMFHIDTTSPASLSSTCLNLRSFQDAHVWPRVPRDNRAGLRLVSCCCRYLYRWHQIIYPVENRREIYCWRWTHFGRTCECDRNPFEDSKW